MPASITFFKLINSKMIFNFDIVTLLEMEPSTTRRKANYYVAMVTRSLAELEVPSFALHTAFLQNGFRDSVSNLYTSLADYWQPFVRQFP